MSMLWGALSGTIVGVYFAEKDLTFPITYAPRPTGEFGSLGVDLQVANVIINDVRGMFGYAPRGAVRTE